MPQRKRDDLNLDLHAGDWLKDRGVRMLTWEQRGMWIDIMLISLQCTPRGYLLRPDGSPMTLDDICIVLSNGSPSETLKGSVKGLVQLGVMKVDERDGAFFCKRIFEDWKYRENQRKFGKKGGNPRLLPETLNDTLKGTDKGDGKGVGQNALNPSFPPFLLSNKEKISPDGEIQKKKRGRPAGVGSRLTEEWEPPRELVAKLEADRPDVDQSIEFRKFQNYWIGKSGKDATKVNWARTYENWILNAKGASYGKGSTFQDQRDQKFLDLADRRTAPALESGTPERASVAGTTEGH